MSMYAQVRRVFAGLETYLAVFLFLLAMIAVVCIGNIKPWGEAALRVSSGIVGVTFVGLTCFAVGRPDAKGRTWRERFRQRPGEAILSPVHVFLSGGWLVMIGWFGPDAFPLLRIGWFGGLVVLQFCLGRVRDGYDDREYRERAKLRDAVNQG